MYDLNVHRVDCGVDMLAESECRWRLIGYFVQCACMALDTPFLLFAHGITTCTGSLAFGAIKRVHCHRHLSLSLPLSVSLSLSPFIHIHGLNH